MDNVNIEFGIRLKKLREDKGLTGEELGDILGVTKASISTYEKGKGMPKAAVIVQMSIFFNVTFDYLFGVDNKDNSKIVSLDGLSSDQCALISNLIEQFKKNNI